MSNRSLPLLSTAALAAVLSVLAVASSSAAAAVTVTKVAPETGPEYSASTVKIHGTGFDTAPGSTTVSFGGQPATDVQCTSTKLCSALTPYAAEGTVPVTVTVGATTSTSPVTFTFTTYSPPKVDILAGRKGAGFSRSKLTDRYPGIITAGNVYLQISNETATAQTFTGPTGSVTLEPGSTFGDNFPVDESSPAVFELAETSAPKKTLTVKTKQPR